MRHLCELRKTDYQQNKRVQKRVYIECYEAEDLCHEVFLNDYTLSLNNSMEKDKYGFWHSLGKEISLDAYIPNKKFYRKGWAEVLQKIGKKGGEGMFVRESINPHGLSVIIASTYQQCTSPAVVICLGGPLTQIPNIYEENSI